MAPDPKNVLFLLEAFRRSAVMFAAVDLGVFDALDAGPLPAAALATQLSVHGGALDQLLDACVSLGLLERDGNAYANTAETRAYLCRNSPQALTGYIDYSRRALWPIWGNLNDAVREGSHRWVQTFGKPGALWDFFYSTEKAKREFLLGLHGYGLLSSPAVVGSFDLGGFSHMVDLGGGTAHLTIALCQRYPNLCATIFDLPGVIPLAEEQVQAEGLSGRIAMVIGDFFTDPLPAADLYAVGRILHDWPAEKIMLLLRKIHAALPEGGALLVAEKLIADDRNGPLWALLQSLNMLLTTEGRERAAGEYAALLRDAGFGEVQVATNDSPLDAIMASK